VVLENSLRLLASKETKQQQIGDLLCAPLNLFAFAQFARA
jgi:hypothetical protein